MFGAGYIGAVVFVAPTLSDSLGGTAISKATTALLFVVGACFGLVQSIPILLNANAAASRIEELETTLRAAGSTEAKEITIPKRFEKIEIRDLTFRYVDKFSDAAFKIGPIDFTLNPGELVFITGGNGSGKSTFLRVLSGLYPPNSGEITLDGVRIDDHNRDTYRGLMSAIFFDYHLFQRLYGIPEGGAAELARLGLAREAVGHHDELVAAQARHRIARARGAAQACGDLAQQGVADIVAEAVVHRLERVEVEHVGREQALGARVLERLREHLVQPATVEQPREGVGVGERMQEVALLRGALRVQPLAAEAAR